jgi:DNA modification methylase
MTRKKVQIETVKLDPSNPRSITKEKFEELKQSIKDFPEMEVVKPLIIADDFVIGGNMRLLAYKDLGYREVHVIDVTAWSQAKRDEFMIKDNTHFGSWNYDMLANEWDNLPLTEWGLEVWDTEVEELKGLTDEDDVPEAPKEPITKLGDVWILGEHRVMCGDSTSKEAVEILMDGDNADMVFTDPPYGVSYQSNMRTKTDKFDVLENDDTFITEWINNLPLYSNGFVFVWTSWKVLKQWIEFCEGIGDLSNIIVWDKGGGGIGDLKKTFSTDYEVALVYHRGAEIIGKRLGSVWSVGKDSGSSYLHPTQKPVELAVMAIENILQRNKIVLDLFLGSGSTLIAAEKTNRKCYGMELDPKYCDVIVKRWEDFTGKKATREIDDLEVITQAH